MIQIVQTDQAPKAVGPYSQAIIHNGLVYLSGQIPSNPEAEISGLTNQVIDQLEAVLIEAGSKLSQVIRVEIFLTDMKDFTEVNGVYAKRFAHKPARQTVQVSALPGGAKIEMSCIAAVGE